METRFIELQQHLDDDRTVITTLSVDEIRSIEAFFDDDDEFITAAIKLKDGSRHEIEEYSAYEELSKELNPKVLY